MGPSYSRVWSGGSLQLHSCKRQFTLAFRFRSRSRYRNCDRAFRSESPRCRESCINSVPTLEQWLVDRVFQALLIGEWRCLGDAAIPPRKSRICRITVPTSAVPLKTASVAPYLVDHSDDFPGLERLGKYGMGPMLLGCREIGARGNRSSLIVERSEVPATGNGDDPGRGV